MTDDRRPVLFKPEETRHKLTDIIVAQSGTDQARWVRALRKLRDEKKRITVMHICDVHAPFQHDQALEVTYQLIKHAQPDVVCVGSDTADLALLSAFAQDPDIDEETTDVLDEFEMFWREHIRRIRQAAPKAIILFIYGNHEMRIFRYLGENARKLRKTVLRRFIEIVRCAGTVWYLGDKVDHVRIGPFVAPVGSLQDGVKGPSSQPISLHNLLHALLNMRWRKAVCKVTTRIVLIQRSAGNVIGQRG